MKKKDLWLNVDLKHGSSSGETNDNPIVNRPFEVPLYDPQTGEPNLEYEALTGKKNPLICDTRPKPFEPKKDNRYSVTFPTEFGIPEWSAFYVSRPSCQMKRTKIFGYTLLLKQEWDEVYFQLYDPIAPSVSSAVMALISEKQLPFTCSINIMDPTGVVIDRFVLNGCVVESVGYSDLKYDTDDFSKIYLSVKPNDVVYIKVK
jgi:hypothetical protein